MSSSKKQVQNLSEILNRKFNTALSEDNKKKSQFIRDAIILYMEERKKLEYIENMKKGYMEMAQINKDISELSSADDLNKLVEYEVWLTECDLRNDNDCEKRRYILR